MCVYVKCPFDDSISFRITDHGSIPRRGHADNDDDDIDVDDDDDSPNLYILTNFTIDDTPNSILVLVV